MQRRSNAVGLSPRAAIALVGVEPNTEAGVIVVSNQERAMVALVIAALVLGPGPVAAQPAPAVPQAIARLQNQDFGSGVRALRRRAVLASRTPAMSMAMGTTTCSSAHGSTAALRCRAARSTCTRARMARWCVRSPARSWARPWGFDTTGVGDVDGDGTIDFLVTSAWSAINRALGPDVHHFGHALGIQVSAHGGAPGRGAGVGRAKRATPRGGEKLDRSVTVS